MSDNVSEIELGCVHANLVVTSSKEHNAKSRLLLIVWSCPPTPYITARGLPQLLHTRTKDDTCRKSRSDGNVRR
ncbi:hypothetical protein BHE74_00055074 [Ensete ventricosum]|nr:hypothetical protein GW17_00017854 [Ensete ventricosum]RWW39586.1 hypothetical protein BHE74_00055074 [Ensete ventricosum]RZS26409.1 hypothetical protein BHM03_00059745 [Ensete ventricosum]